MKNTMLHVIWVFLLVLFAGFSSQAQQLSYHGRIIDTVTNLGVNGLVEFRIQVRTPSTSPANCLMYEEVVSRNVVNGVFVLNVNSGAGAVSPLNGYNIQQVFSNKNTFGAFNLAGNCSAGGPLYNPGSTDTRRVSVQFRALPTDPWESLPTQAVAYVPAAIESLNVGGFSVDALMRVVDGAGAPFNVSPLNNTQYTELVNTLTNNSSFYLKLGDPAVGFTGALAGDVTGTQGATTVGRLRGVNVDLTGLVPGQTLSYNGTSFVPVTDGGGTVTNVSSANAYLSVATGATTPVLTVNVGTVANTVAAGDDARITNSLQLGSAASGDLSGTYPNPSVATVGGRTAAQINTSVGDTIAATSANTASTIVKRDGSGNVAVTSLSATNASVNNLYIYNAGNVNNAQIRMANAVSGDYTLTLPTTLPQAGTLLGTNASGDLSWVNPSAIGVTNVTASAPLASSGGSTPNITITQAGAASNGYLSSADWTTFNNKRSTNLTTGMVWVGDGTNTAAEQFLGITNIRSSIVPAANPFFNVAGPCAAGTTLTYSVVTDQVSCTAYSLTGAQVASALSTVMSGDATMNASGDVTISNGAVNNAKISDVAWGKVTGTPTTIAGYGITDAILTEAGGVDTMQASTDASRPAAAAAPFRVYVSTDTGEIYYSDGVTWTKVGSAANVTGTAPIVVTNGTTTPQISITRSSAGADGYLASTDFSTFNNKLSTTLANGAMWIGNAGGNAAAVTMSGDASISNTGVLTLVNTAVTPGTYPRVTVDSKGRVTNGGALVSTDVTTGLGYTPVNKAGDTMSGTLNLPSNGLAVGTTQLTVSGGRVGVGVAAADASSLLEISSTTAGFLIPRMNNGQRNAIVAPATGLQVYNTTTSTIDYWDGGTWKTLTFAGGALTDLNGLTNPVQSFAVGTAGTDFAINSAGSTHTFNLPTASAANRGALSSQDWTTFNNKLGTTTAHSGDVTGTYNALTVQRIQGAAVSAVAPTNAQVLVYNGTQYVAQNVSGDAVMNNAGNLTLSNTGVTASADYSKVTVDSKGRVTAAGYLASSDVAAALGYSPVATVTAVDPLIQGGTARDPVISINPADAGTDGFLTSTDWTLFNNKLGTTTAHSGDVTGTYNNITVQRIRGTPVVIGGLASGNYLRYNGTDWVNTNLISTDITGSLGYTPATNSLPNGQIFVGNAGGVATAVVMSGDANISNTGNVTLTNSGVTAGTYKGGVTVDSKGRVTAGIASLDLTNGVTGVLPVANGGTGQNTLTSGSILVGNGVGGVNTLAAGAANNVIYGTGASSWASGTPDTAGLVDKSSAQSISGAKTFTNNLRIDAANSLRLGDADSSNYVGLRVPNVVSSDVTFTLPGTDGVNGQVLYTNGAGQLGWITTATGTVQSVQLIMPSIFNVGGTNPVTTNGSFDVTLANQNANMVFAGPSNGAAAAPTFRALASSDIPQVTLSASGNGGVGGTLGIANGGTGQTTAVNAFNALSPSTTKGDLIVHNGTDDIRVAVGANGTMLRANSAQASGVEWGTIVSTDVTSWLGYTPVATVSVADPLIMGGTAKDPVISINPADAGTDGYLTSTDWTLFNNKLGTTTAHSGDVTGTYNNITVQRIRGTPVVIGGLASGNYLRYNGTDWVNTNLISTDITGSLGYTPATNSLPNGQIFVGNAGGVATAVVMSGDANISNTGNVTLTNSGVTAGTYKGGVTVDSKGRVTAGIASLDLTNGVTGVLPVANGGTGQNTLTSGNLIVGNGAGAVNTLAPGANGNVLYVTGGAWTSATPTSADLVTISTAQTISGAKTLTNSLTLNAQNETRYADNDSSNYVAIRAPTNVGSNVTFTLPNAYGTNGQVLSTNASGDLSWISTATGTVTSFDITGASIFNITGGPITTTGTINLGLANQNANMVFAGPSNGAAAAPTFRALASSDIPQVTLSASGNGGVGGTLGIANGGTGQTTAVNAFNALSPSTTKGDLIVHNGTDDIRVAVGANGTMLRANSAQASGVEWGTIVSTDVTSWLGYTPVATVSVADPLIMGGTAKDPVISINQADGGTDGFLASTDWTLFNNKLGTTTAHSGDVTGTYNNITVQRIRNTPVVITALAAGDYLRYDGTNWVDSTLVSTDITGSIGYVPVSSVAVGGAPLVLGGTATAPSISITQATGAAHGYLTSNDWTTFNNKLGTSLAAGNIFVGVGGVATAVSPSGDVSSITGGNIQLANTGVTAGTYQRVTVDAKGRVTAGFPSTDVSVATGTLAIGNGGTGQTTAVNAFNALSPLTTKGDIVVNNGTDDVRLAVGADGLVLRANSAQATGLEWAAAATGTVTSFDVTGASIFNITGGPITTTGTINLGLANQNANMVFAGPSNGAAAAPTFRALASSDIPQVTLSASGNGGVGGTLGIANGGTGQTTAVNAFNALSPSTTKGDLIVHNGTDDIRVAVGANGTMLRANSAQASGVEWGTIVSTDVTSWLGYTPVATVSVADPLIMGGTAKDPVISINQADGGTDGFLASTDWTTFNNKLGTATAFSGDVTGAYNAITVQRIRNTPVVITALAAGDYLRYDGTNWVDSTLVSTDITGSIGYVPVSSVAVGGAPLVLGGTAMAPSISITQATGAAHGYLTSNDWTTFNNKLGTSLAAGNIFVGVGGVATAVSPSGDVSSITGGNIQLSNTGVTAGTYQRVTVDAKGRVTAGFPSTDVSVATGTLAIGNGGTGQTTAVAAFNALSPLTTKGDIVVNNGTDDVRLPVGADGLVLRANSAQATGLEWAAAATGTVTSFDVTGASIFNITGGPITTTGTINLGLANQNANMVFAGPSNGAAAAPTFRALASSDIPQVTLSASGNGGVGGTLGIANGGTGQTTAVNAFNALSPSTTKGDLIVHNGTDDIRVAVGANGTMLRANSAQASGVEWGTIVSTDVTSWLGYTPVATVSVADPLIMGGTAKDPVISINQADGGTDGFLASTDWTTFNNKLGTATAFSGDVTGAYNAITVQRIRNTPVVITALAAGDYLRYDGTNWVDSTLVSTDITGSIGYVPVSSVAVGGAPLVLGGTAMAPSISITQATGAAHGYLTSNDWTTFNNKLGTSLAAGNIFVGVGGVATAVSPSGDVSSITGGNIQLSNTGVTAGTYQRVTVDAKGRVTAGFPSTDVSVATGTLAIGNGGTGQTTAVAAFNALSPLTTKGDIVVNNGTDDVRLPVGADGLVLRANSAQATGLEWAAAATGTVTSFDVTGASIFNITGGPITTTGTINLGLANQNANMVFAGPSNGAAAAPTFRALASSDIPQVTLSASGNGGVGGTLGIANGGTGQTTAVNAFNALSPSTTKGDLIVHNGTDDIRVAVGANGTMLRANSAQASGVEWGTIVSTDVTSWLGYTPVATVSVADPLIMGGTAKDPVISINQATATDHGYLTSQDWTTFNSKLSAAAAFSGDVTGTYNNITVQRIRNTPVVITALAAGDYLRYDGTNWVDSTLVSTDITGSLGYVPATSALPNGQIFVGNASNVATAVVMSGDANIANTGIVTLTNSGVTAGTYKGGVTVDSKGRVTAASASLDLTNGVTGALPVANGGTGQTTAVAAFNALSPLTSKGDIVANDGTDDVRLPAGADGRLLRTNSATASGLEWAAIASTDVTGWLGYTPASNALPNGQIFVGNASNVATAVVMSGDANIANTGIVTLTNSGVTAGTYKGGVTVDSKGRVTAASASLDLTNGVTGALPVANGGTGQTTAVAAFNALSPLTTKGDLIVNDGTDDIRVAVGANGSFLKANSVTGSGVQWSTPVSTDVTSWLGYTPVASVAVGGAPLVLGGTATAPSISITQADGTNHGYLTSNDWTTFNNKLGTATSFSGDVTGAYNNITVQRIRNTPVVITALAAGDYLRYDGTNWVDSTLVSTDITGSLGYVPATNTLANGNIFVGNASNVATAVVMSGDASISNTGIVTLANSGVTAGTYAGALAIDSKGRVTSGAASLDLTTSVTGALPIANGGTGQTSKTNAYDALSPNTTKGDIEVYDGTDNVRQAVGANNTFLKANSAQSTGVQWSTLVSTDISAGTGYVQSGNSFGAEATIGTNDNNNFVFKTNNIQRGRFIAGGSFQVSHDVTTGIASGTDGNAPTSNGNLQVNGQGWSKRITSSAASPLTWDTNNGNTLLWTQTAASPTINIHNMKPGGSYMFVIDGDNTSTGTVTINCFSDAGVTGMTEAFMPANGNRLTSGALDKTVYTLMYDGTDCMITWITGY